MDAWGRRAILSNGSRHSSTKAAPEHRSISIWDLSLSLSRKRWRHQSTIRNLCEIESDTFLTETHQYTRMNDLLILLTTIGVHLWSRLCVKEEKGQYDLIYAVVWSIVYSGVQTICKILSSAAFSSESVGLAAEMTHDFALETRY